ncbi:cytochrome P450 [Sphingomonas solaris]|uniref:Cytochrome P450 n=1 Tax=Alterirhizorhabdus solaris TaxID=2529389 RepID=A0A558RCM7_9SPHN|nr:cytochrome P450 [Sphingomonas solaris]TVV77104.1 cytochrome P450 [Sphingomonas solaris]
MAFAFPEPIIPAHVPADLVRSFPFIFGTTTEQDPFNDLAAAVHEGPAIIYAPHAYPGGTPAWVPRRTEDLRAIYFDTEHFSSNDFSPFAKLVGETWTNSPAELDPPDHGPFRTMINPVFTPKAVAALEGRIRAYAIEYVDSFATKGACEFMGDFAFEFPIRVFMELMGLPRERMGQFLDWEMNLLHNHDLAKIAAATRSVVDYLREEIEERRANPREDLITFGVQAQKQGARLTDDELVGFTFNLFIGGLDTVSTNIGLHFWHLATHREDQAALRADPTKIPNAIEEMMRAYGAVTTFRTCKKEITINDVTFLPGDKVAMSTTLAGRDPAEFADPAIVRFDRRPRHVSFGFGPHICVGMHLARREMRIAMEEFLARIPDFRVADEHRVRCHLGMIQPVELPLVWQA